MHRQRTFLAMRPRIGLLAPFRLNEPIHDRRQQLEASQFVSGNRWPQIVGTALASRGPQKVMGPTPAKSFPRPPGKQAEAGAGALPPQRSCAASRAKTDHSSQDTVTPIDNNGRRPDARGRSRNDAVPRVGPGHVHELDWADHLRGATSPRPGDSGGTVYRRSRCHLRVTLPRQTRILISRLAPPQGRGHSLSVSPPGLGQKWLANARGPLASASHPNLLPILA